jgi:hypothetical protein
VFISHLNESRNTDSTSTSPSASLIASPSKKQAASFHKMFQGARSFNADISGWDVRCEPSHKSSCNDVRRVETIQRGYFWLVGTSQPEIMSTLNDVITREHIFIVEQLVHVGDQRGVPVLDRAISIRRIWLGDDVRRYVLRLLGG